METLRTAGEEILRHALRSMLTLSGIVLGCLGLVVMSAIMDGVGASVRQGFADLGFDGVLSIRRGPPATPEESRRFMLSPGLTPADAEALRQRGEHVLAASARLQTQAVVSREGVALNARVFGVEPDHALVRNRRPAEGRFVSEFDLATSARSCVLGSTLRTRLFGAEECLGREITIGDVRFTVVGVGRKLGNAWFHEGQLAREMEGVTVPLTTFRSDVRREGDDSPTIDVRIRDPDDLAAAVAEVRRIVQASHHGIRDFELENLAAEAVRGRDETRKQLRSWRIVMVAVAAVTLLVGGVGLLSVLLISLAERTYEIGVRKALGATGADVFALFLVESLALALLGAVLGILGGIGVTKLASRGFPDGLPQSPGGIALALAAAVFVGLAFGIGPALRASRMAPVDALRETA